VTETKPEDPVDEDEAEPVELPAGAVELEASPVPVLASGSVALLPPLLPLSVEEGTADSEPAVELESEPELLSVGAEGSAAPELAVEAAVLPLAPLLLPPVLLPL
jgi:hypothetical protein